MHLRNKLVCLLGVLLVSCGTEHSSTPPSKSTKEKLEVLSVKLDAYALSSTEAEEGDSVLFNGIQCLADKDKFAQACADVKASQGADGRMWRAPARVDKDLIDSFSRDMAMGTAAYLVATHDTELAQKWQSYFEKEGKLCSVSSDSRCDFTPALFGLLGDVWENIGLEPSNSMEAGQVGDDSTVYVQTASVDTGYQLHLNSVYLFVKQRMNQSGGVLTSIANKLVERQPNNPWYQYLAGNKDKAGKLVLAQAPATLPKKHTQWSFQRDTAEKAWLNSYGQEFKLLVHLILN